MDDPILIVWENPLVYKGWNHVCVFQQGQEEEFEDYLKELIELLLKKMVCSVLKTRCMLGNFSCFCCCLPSFSKICFLKKSFQEHYQSVKRLGSRSGWRFCRSWSGSKLFAKDNSR